MGNTLNNTQTAGNTRSYMYILRALLASQPSAALRYTIRHIAHTVLVIV